MISFGAYEIAKTKTRNIMTSNEVAKHLLIPSNNQGEHYFTSYLTGKRIYTNIWEE